MSRSANAIEKEGKHENAVSTHLYEVHSLHFLWLFLKLPRPLLGIIRKTIPFTKA